jgi:NADH-quinone oxidoreductase subunit G
MGIDPAKIYMVSIMPCTSKKYEITRTGEMFSSGHQDIDVVLTTRELSRMIKSAGIDFANLPDEECDSILGDYSGAGTIFGATGGVMEAALRSAYYLVTKKNLEDVNFMDVRGLEGVKEAVIDIEGTKVRVAVAHQMSNIEKVLEKIRENRKKGEKPCYDFIEVMACRGGCVGGGGQPYGATDEIRKARASGLYIDDREAGYRCSHENPEIQKIYSEFLGEPLGHNAHRYLHTSYQPRKKYDK